jgi:hypothetical protein
LKEPNYIVATNKKCRSLLKCVKGCFVEIEEQNFNAFLSEFYNLKAKFSSLISLGVGS